MKIPILGMIIFTVYVDPGYGILCAVDQVKDYSLPASRVISKKMCKTICCQTTEELSKTATMINVMYCTLYSTLSLGECSLDFQYVIFKRMVVINWSFPGSGTGFVTPGCTSISLNGVTGHKELINLVDILKHSRISLSLFIIKVIWLGLWFWHLQICFAANKNIISQ